MPAAPDAAHRRRGRSSSSSQSWAISVEVRETDWFADGLAGGLGVESQHLFIERRCSSGLLRG